MSSSPTAITSSDATTRPEESASTVTGVNSEGDEEDESVEGEEEEDEEAEEEEEHDEEGSEERCAPSVEFSVGELVWGAARGHPSLPGKVVPAPNGGGESSSGKRSVWVRWFGGRPVIELVPMELLKSLSEGLDAHHRAQKDTRK